MEQTSATNPAPRNLTPAMERYLEVKRQNPGSILLFRMGDFYELFFEDAVVSSKVLGLTLTSRDKGSTNPIPMAGFPYHALEGYLRKLIVAGHRVAVCEQMEDPKLAKGMIKREVTQVVTPGTLIDEALLDPRESNFLASVWPSRAGSVGLAWLEVSTGRFVTSNLEPAQLADELARIRPSECVYPEHLANDERLRPLFARGGLLATPRAPWCWAEEACRSALLKHFGTTTLEGFDIDSTSAGVTAAGALLEYVQEMQKSSLAHISRLEPYRRGTSLIIDEATRASLELTRTIREGKRDNSLLSVLDETVSPMGARLLAEWLSNPLANLGAINRRLDAVEELTRDTMFCRDLREILGETYDLQRLTAKVATGRASPRDLGSLTRSLALLPRLKAKLAGRQSALLQLLEADLDLNAEIRAIIDATLVDEPPLLTTDGGAIRPGFNATLDELRDLARGGKEWIARYQAKESERLGLPNLKVGFNKVFGYYLEVTAAQAAKIPPEYIRKQTLKNQERFITPELKEYEDKVLRAEERAISLEQELFAALRERVAAATARLKQTADVLSEVDVLAALATLAVKQGYCRPELTDDPILDIREGRHPVLDKLMPSGSFVPNDVKLGVPSSDAVDAPNTRNFRGRVQLITGPNMAGKSTYIRQAALLTIMAQMGSFIPASEARIGIADRIFARVGASDELSKGQSTFMVEMTETARILNSASDRSLVILDEIGRGTSTYDGISLAWAVTEFLHDQIRCRTLFATHYHELTELTKTLPETSNWNVAIREHGDDIVFLHKIVEGPADKSYGIHVAKIAGLPREVVERAQVILAQLESDHVDESGKVKIPERKTKSRDRQLSLFIEPDHPVIEKLRSLDIEQLTPIAALQKLNELRESLTK
ncbi:MAG: DNA mismatch repair protein MutS [Planctomycetota bacterium]|nr:MAG: DNA mismatch repair protein MutS [Planctomycetota bacterium]